MQRAGDYLLALPPCQVSHFIVGPEEPGEDSTNSKILVNETHERFQV